MNDLKRLAHVAQALDLEGLHAQADALTAVMCRLQHRAVRTAQALISDPFGSGQQGLTFEAVTRNVPGADFLTNNLASGAFGSQAGLNQNLPRWTYQQGGSETPIDQSSLWEFNQRGMTAEQRKKLKDAEYARNAQLSLAFMIPEFRQWGEFYKKTPVTPEKKNELVSDIVNKIKGADPSATKQAIAQGWPDMPQDIKQMVEQKLQGIQMVNALPQFSAGVSR